MSSIVDGLRWSALGVCIRVLASRGGGVGCGCHVWAQILDPSAACGSRSGLNAARTSVVNTSGSSQAAKWPPGRPR